MDEIPVLHRKNSKNLKDHPLYYTTLMVCVTESHARVAFQDEKRLCLPFLQTSFPFASAPCAKGFTKLFFFIEFSYFFLKKNKRKVTASLHSPLVSLVFVAQKFIARGPFHWCRVSVAYFQLFIWRKKKLIFHEFSMTFNRILINIHSSAFAKFAFLCRDLSRGTGEAETCWLNGLFISTERILWICIPFYDIQKKHDNSHASSFHTQQDILLKQPHSSLPSRRPL